MAKKVFVKRRQINYENYEKVAAVLLAVMLMAPAAVNAAAPSATKATIAGQKAAVSTVYTGKAQLPATVTINGKTLIAGQDFVYVNAAAKTDAGTYTVSIKGIGAFRRNCYSNIHSKQSCCCNKDN